MGKETKHLESKPKKKVRSEEYLKYQRYIRSKDFKENVRDKVLKRDNYMCQTCGRTKDDISLSCHHRTYENLFKHDMSEINDCITLCKICHKCIHSAISNFQRFKRNK